ncbi:MAG: response regulator [Elusimicrobia bacterium]|nr:response regulator [Elusimicrobiota bacterium]
MKSARVLIVDDEPPIIEVLLRALAAKGHVARTVDNAEDAAALLNEPFDLILLDHVLPGATGMQSLSRLRALTRAPVHLMSGDSEVRQDALLLGATGFLEKPFDIQQIFALIEALPERNS